MRDGASRRRMANREMNQRDQERLARAGMIGSVATALGASICCIGPILAVTFGFTGLLGLARYEPLRPYMVATTVALLGWAFYVTYRATPVEECEPDSVCARHGIDRMRRLNLIALWTAAVAAFVIATFPTWSGWILV